MTSQKRILYIPEIKFESEAVDFPLILQFFWYAETSSKGIRKSILNAKQLCRVF